MPTCRLATADDIPALRQLIERAIAELQGDFLDREGVAASRAIMGLDSQLIADGTYFVAEGMGGEIVGCGGWSRRATPYGGDHSAGRDAALLDPTTDAARVRAMYTHPDHVRQGIGRAILTACEAAAAAAGFSRTQLTATLAGEPLYRANGYEQVERFGAPTPDGGAVPVVLMTKVLGV